MNKTSATERSPVQEERTPAAGRKAWRAPRFVAVDLSDVTLGQAAITNDGGLVS